MHGLAYSADGSKLTIPSHHGLAVYEGGRWSKAPGPQHDYMGYSATRKYLYSSGHPAPGSGLVKEQAEAEGLDKVFTDAGLEWREPGCSACLGMNPDKVPAGERCASTSNRNFVGRQGPGARTHLVSPAMAAAAAVTGKLTDVRELV